MMRSSDHTSGPTPTQLEKEKKLGRALGPWDRHQIPIVKWDTNCFMGVLFKSCLGHQFYDELTGTQKS